MQLKEQIVFLYKLHKNIIYSKDKLIAIKKIGGNTLLFAFCTFRKKKKLQYIPTLYRETTQHTSSYC